MSIEKAKCLYLGKCGDRRMNCAESVVTAYQDQLFADDNYTTSFEAFGGGRAPGGLCGAYYAAKIVIDERNPALALELEEAFLQAAGSLQCVEIKMNRSLTCVACVEKSAGYIGSMLAQQAE